MYSIGMPNVSETHMYGIRKAPEQRSRLSRIRLNDGTSAILVRDGREAPDVAEADGVADTRQNVL